MFRCHSLLPSGEDNETKEQKEERKEKKEQRQAIPSSFSFQIDGFLSFSFYVLAFLFSLSLSLFLSFFTFISI